MSLEATNKLLCSKGSICCKLKLNKENNPLLFCTPWKLWASSPLGQNSTSATARDVPSSKVPGTMWPALCKTLSTHIPDEKWRLTKGN